MARAGGSRSGGGGSRGFGGGGNRSFGGRSGGGSFNRGGAQRPRPPSGGGMGFGPGPGGPMYMGSPFGRPFRRMRRPMFGGGGCGCLVLPIILIVIFVIGGIMVFASPFSSQDSSSVTKSTVEREPLPAGSVVETEYYTDELDWIRNPTTLTTGMKNFYKETGVQPYLYLTDTIAGTHTPTESQVEAFANETYDTLFADEAHFLLIFFEYQDQYHTWYLTGTQANSVMDQEAVDILLDYVDKYYYYDDLTDDEFFSRAFDEAGERIMHVTVSPWIPVLIVAGVLAIIAVAFFWWRNAKKQKNLEAEQTQKILDTPLESFGDDEAENLEDKYK